ncbi:MAG: PqqD family peptide modification chaperone [Granulosicoccus sp.]
MFSIELEDDCWVLVDSSGTGVRLVNGVARFIASLSGQGVNTQTIVARLMERYDVDSGTATADVAAVLEKLQDDTCIELKAVVPYQPLTDFVPANSCEPVESCECFLPGFRLSFASELPGLVHYLQQLFPLPTVSDEPLKDLTIEIYKDGDRAPLVHQGKTLDTGLALTDTALKCLREVNGIIGREVPYSIIFHASAVARNGKAVLFPAVGGSGKTTLSAYLMAQGFLFLNDDAVPLCSESALLQPIPLSLSIKRGSWSVLDKWYPALKNTEVYGAADFQVRYLPPLAESVCRQAVACALVVLPVYSPSATALKCEQVSTRAAFENIIKSGCILDQPVDPGQISALVNWLKALPVYRVTYSDLHDVEQWLNQYL